MYQALYRKYRPRTFEDVVGQEHITETLRRQVATGRTSHAYLFVGTRGTGKTTCAKILSRALNCEHPVNGDPCNECDACRGIESGAILDVAEIDAASNNGVDNIRSIRDEAIYTPADVKKRVYIIDEVHMLSTSAFNALLKILEEPPEHLVFILATTELNKVPATILSRCQHFSFRRIMPENIAKRLKYVADREGFTLTDGAADLLSRLADGSMRDGLSLLDQCVSSDTVDEAAVMSAVGLMGTVNTVNLWNKLTSGDTAGALELFETIYYGGAEPISVLNDLLSLTRDMLMVRVAPRGSRGLLTGAFSPERLNELSRGLDAGRLLALSEILQEAAAAMRDARDKRVKAELTLIKLGGTLSGTYRAPETYAPAAQAVPVPEAPVSIPQAAPVQQAPVQEPAPRPEPEPEEGPPPWEDADIPPEDAVPWHELQAPEPPPEPRREPARTAPKPQPRSEVPKPQPQPQTVPTPAAPLGAAPEGDWWGQVLAVCAGTVDGGTYTFLSNRNNTAPVLTGNTLVLHVRNSFVKMMVDSAAVKAAVTGAAGQVLGRGVTVTVAAGMPETPPAAPTPGAPKEDKLDSLARFDGIVKFK